MQETVLSHLKQGIENGEVNQIQKFLRQKAQLSTIIFLAKKIWRLDALKTILLSHSQLAKDSAFIQCKIIFSSVDIIYISSASD